VTWERWFVVAIALLNFAAAIGYALRKRYAEAIMFAGAGLANVGAVLIPGPRR
jgi:hypothetical protein